jgi:signal transduction histidine kinase
VIRIKSIFLKLFLTYITILFVSFFVLTTVSYLLFQSDLDKKHRNSDRNQLHSVVEYIKKSYEDGWNRDILLSSLEFSIANEDKAFYLYDESGSLLYHVGQDHKSFNVDRELVQEGIAEKKRIRKVMKDGNSEQRIFLETFPIEGDETIQEKMIVMVSYGFERDFARMKYLFVLASIISITITGLLIYYLSRRITAPLREMNRVAHQIAKGQFDQRVKVKTSDELGQLGESFNYMARELASLDQMRKDFVANVSHDLRSPLTSIHGFVRAFLDHTIPKDREHHYLSAMKEQTERMIKLVNDLLDMARIEAGQLEIRPVIFNLSELVRQVIARMEPEFVKSQIDIDLISEEGEDLHVFADPDRIDQVIVNLIHNAMQFSPSSTHVEVILKKEDKAIVSVRDYGSGIKKEDIKHIWKRFYKADKARSKKQGTGIGLSIVKHILDLHQTSIHVDSQEGKGTTFAFTLSLPTKETENHKKS